MGPGLAHAVPDIRGGSRLEGEMKTQPQDVFFCSFWTFHQLTVVFTVLLDPGWHGWDGWDGWHGWHGWLVQVAAKPLKACVLPPLSSLVCE